MMMVVLSNIKQYEKFHGIFGGRANVKILCDNASFFGFLEEKGVIFDRITDKDVISEKEYPLMNKWACDKALLWGEISDKEYSLDGMELDKTLYIYFSYYLASLIKNFHFAKSIIDRFKPCRILVFKGTHRPDFPSFNGNYFLNHFLGEMAGERGVLVEQIDELYDQGKRNFDVKEKLRQIFKSLFERVFLRGQRSVPSGILLCGNLFHLSLLMDRLREKTRKIVFYDPIFQFRNFFFCLRKRIRYVVPEVLDRKLSENKDESAVIKESLTGVFNDLKERKWFQYEGRDFSGFVSDEITAMSGRYVCDISSDLNTYRKVIGGSGIESVVLSEDIQPRSAFMAAFFKAKNIKVFVVSHGYGPITFSIDKAHRRYFLSETFVHSGYEKELYSSWGWDDRHIHITGLPRYDVLSLLRDMKSVKKSRKMKVLYCGAMMKDEDPTLTYYLGVAHNENGHHTRACLGDLINLIPDLNVELVIKPHYKTDEHLWRNFIAKFKNKDRNIRLVSASSDFMKLLGECDMMITSHWSTAVIEGVILEKPVVIVDYSGFTDFHPFSEEGLCTVVRDPDSLRQVVTGIYDTFADSGQVVNDLNKSKDKVFFTGNNDGKAVDRVLKMVLPNLEMSENFKKQKEF